jgi:hypothetical protein
MKELTKKTSKPKRKSKNKKKSLARIYACNEFAGDLKAFL